VGPRAGVDRYGKPRPPPPTGIQSPDRPARSQSLYRLSHPAHSFNPFNADLNLISHLLALLGAHHILHVSRIRVKMCINSVSFRLQDLKIPSVTMNTDTTKADDV